MPSRLVMAWYLQSPSAYMQMQIQVLGQLVSVLFPFCLHLETGIVFGERMESSL